MCRTKWRWVSVCSAVYRCLLDWRVLSCEEARRKGRKMKKEELEEGAFLLLTKGLRIFWSFKVSI